VDNQTRSMKAAPSHPGEGAAVRALVDNTNDFAGARVNQDRAVVYHHIAVLDIRCIDRVQFYRFGECRADVELHSRKFDGGKRLLLNIFANDRFLLWSNNDRLS